MENNTCDFSFAHYREMLEVLKENGYTFLTFHGLSQIEESELPEKIVLLRHDVDKSTSKALKFADIESELSIPATYFIRLHSNYYNPFSYVAYKELKEIETKQHEIGLHTEFFDMAKINKEDGYEMLEREIEIFQHIFKTPVKTLAPHRTSGSSTMERLQENLEKVYQGLGIPHAYQSIFTHDFRYLSDSSAIWREGCLCQHLLKHHRYHILTHPCWWFEEHIELEEPLV
ncbi:hypothetical protein EBR25_07815 [bacterium]|nr:hypothetical protein [bacterium]